MFENIRTYCKSAQKYMAADWQSVSKTWFSVYAALAILLFLLAAYLPLIQGYFLVSRDYWGFVYEHSNFLNRLTFNAEGDTGSYGRPLAGYIAAFFHSLITTINGANLVRCVLILLLAFAAYLFHLWLRILNTDQINAVLISVAIFTLPPFQANASSISQAPVLLGILLSICAGMFLHRSLYSAVGLPNTVRVAYGSLAIILLFLSLITYPLSTMFFWIMLAVQIGRLEISTFIRKRVQILLSFCIPGMAIGIYFIFFRLTQRVLPATEVLFHPIDRLQWFIDQPFSVALNLWNIHKSSLTSLFVGVVLLSGLLLAIAADISRRSPEITRRALMKYVCLKYFSLISLLPLSILPMMAAKNYDFLSYRHLVALSPLIFIAFIWSAAHIGSLLVRKGNAVILTTGLAVVCLYGVWSAHDNVQNNIVVPMSAELKYFKKTLSQYEPSKIKRIHVIASTKRHRTLLPNYEEFSGFQSALGIPYHGAFNPALVLTAIKELAREDTRFAEVRKNWDIGRAVDVVTYSTKEDFEKQKIVLDLKNTVVIDMTQIEFLVDSGISQENEPLTSGKSEMKPAAGPDQCTGGTAISGGDYPGFPAFQAFDDDSISTRWASKQTGLENAGVAYIGYDFGKGAKKHIRQLSLRQGGAITSVKVQRSDDGRLWRDVTTLSLQGDNNTYLHDLPPSQAARFWRLLANANTGDGPSAWTVYEIEMMEAVLP